MRDFGVRLTFFRLFRGWVDLGSSTESDWLEAFEVNRQGCERWEVS